MPKRTDRITEVFGDYKTTLPPSREHLTILVAPTAFPIEWSLGSVTANFLASYFDTFFPTAQAGPDGSTSREEVWDSVSYISNELIENSMKFHHDKRIDMVVNIMLYPDEVIFLNTNSVDPATLDKFYAFIRELTSEDPMDLYIRHMEEGLESLEKTTSGIGFLTIMANYHAKIGWKFDIINASPKIVTVSTMVQLPITR